MRRVTKSDKGRVPHAPVRPTTTPARRKEAPATEITRASALGWLVCAGRVLRSLNGELCRRSSEVGQARKKPRRLPGVKVRLGPNECGPADTHAASTRLNVAAFLLVAIRRRWRPARSSAGALFQIALWG